MKTYIILLTLILTSCHILKKDRATLNKLHQKEAFQFEEQRYILREKNELVINDSSHNDVTMLLWPKGKFTFSIAKGFEGEAERILIKGKQSNQKRTNLKQESNQDSTLIKTNYSNEKEGLTIVKKSKVKVRFKWYWLFVLPVAYIIYRLYKMHNNQLKRVFLR